MTTYSLERFSILLVEDNPYVREILADVLKSLSFGRVLVAENGVEAIELLGGGKSGYAQPVDLIISDMIMAPVDGFLLLRWVRQGRDSPNRFLPFVMMSGAADAVNVEKARDHGANEFLAKPFSAASVSSRVLSVIDRPRQYIATRDYFGPDRKRLGEKDVNNDRRRTEEKDVTIVYSSEKVVRPKDPRDVFYFRLQNALKEKAGGIGSSGAGQLPVGALEEADGKLERKVIAFHDWAQEYLRTLSRICELALKMPEERRREPFEKINLLAHELRGQGGTFGYPLITHAGKTLFEVTQAPCPLEDRAITVVKAHLDAMRIVFRDRITGEGGETGRELLASLARSIEKYSKKDRGKVRPTDTNDSPSHLRRPE